MSWRWRRQHIPQMHADASKAIVQRQEELIRKFIEILKDNHTQEEVELLENGYWGVSIYDVLNNIGIEYLRLLYVISQKPMEDLPLFINEEDRFTKQYVCWRLKVGK